MKKSTIFLLILNILLILFVAFMYKQIIEISGVQQDLISTIGNGGLEINSKILELEAEIEELKSGKESESITNTTTTSTVKFDSNKMKSTSTNVRYEENTDWIPNNAGLSIEIKDGKAYLSTDVEDEQYKLVFPEITKAVKNKEISGFKLDVKEIYYAYMGNGDPCPLILFLMEDGTVEFVDSSKMLKNKKYESEGKIKELSNIVKFVHLDAQDVDENGEGMSGWLTVGAIDEDGYAYDLYECDAIKNIKE